MVFASTVKPNKDNLAKSKGILILIFVDTNFCEVLDFGYFADTNFHKFSQFLKICNREN